MIDAVAERLAAAVFVVSLILARNKCWYGLQIIILGQTVCVWKFIYLYMHPRSRRKFIQKCLYNKPKSAARKTKLEVIIKL